MARSSGIRRGRGKGPGSMGKISMRGGKTNTIRKGRAKKPAGARA